MRFFAKCHRGWCERALKTPQKKLDMQNGTFVMHPNALAILDKYGSVENTPLTISVDTDGQQVSLELD